MDARTYLMAGLVALLFILANGLTKESLKEGREWLVPVLFLLGGTAFVAFRSVCKVVELARASAVVDSLLLIGTILLAVVFFGERLPAYQWFLLAGLVTILFLLR